jgi:hypothetical protein
MFKAITNLSSAVADITIIVAKETAHQVASTNACYTNASKRVAWKAGEIRRTYEERLSNRKRKPLAIEYIPENQN